MKNYDERTRYILEQRNIRIEKHRNIRGTITAAAGMAGALAIVVGTTVAMSGIAGRDGLSSAVAQSGQLAAEAESGKEFDGFDKSAAYSEYIWPLDKDFDDINTSGKGWQIKINILNAGERNVNVYAVRSGTVAQVDAFMHDDGRYYNVVIDHGNGISTFYSTFASENLEVEKGQKVKQGDIIGTTSRNVDSGVKFEIFKDGVSVCPFDYIPLPSDDYGKPDIAIDNTEIAKPQLNLPDKHLFVLKNDYDTPIFNFRMEEFPNTSFVLDKDKNTLFINGAEIFSGMPINSLYVADLNGDGYREIVADVNWDLLWGLETGDSRIFAYDYKNDALYQLADRFNYNYYTTFYNNEVGYEYRAYGSTCGVADGSGELTLDIMTKISGYTPNWEAMTPVLSGWDINSSLFNTLIYSDGDARVTVFFRMNGEPSQITDNDTAAAGYSAVYKTEWLETKDKDGNTIAEFTINDMPIRVTFNRMAKEKLGDVIGLAIKAFRQSTVRYDYCTEDTELENYIVQTQANSKNEMYPASYIPPVALKLRFEECTFADENGFSHIGVDYSSADIAGAKVFAAQSGTVIMMNTDLSHRYGNFVVIDHGNGMSTLYAHCQSLAVENGQTVEQGDVIAAVGSTGQASKPHLHFEVRIHGRAVNPQIYISK